MLKTPKTDAEASREIKKNKMIKELATKLGMTVNFMLREISVAGANRKFKSSDAMLAFLEEYSVKQ